MRRDDFCAEALLSARDALLSATPLRRDCGSLCGAACCSPDEDGRGGMLLFPGETACYRALPRGFKISATPQGPLLTCRGVCQREDRPLACRIFPLMFTAENGKIGLALDPRAWPLCPLMPSGLSGLWDAFVAAANQAAALLEQDPAQVAFIEQQQAYVKELSKLPWAERESV